MKHSSSCTALVTVTYSDRIHYLGQLLDRAFDSEGIGQAVVVSNASTSDLSILKEKWKDRVRLVRLPTNTGSANGYAEGISEALKGNAEFLWLMDDDNVPKFGALEILHLALANLSKKCGPGNASVLGFRPDHQADIAEGIDVRRAIPSTSSFLGFHYRQIPFKIARRLNRKQSNYKLPKSVFLPYAPYGGLLASRTLFENIGLPKRELILYADDTEYTNRITANGGRIELITDALLEDLEDSWSLKKNFSNAFLGQLLGGSDFRAFYSTRNRAWFDKHQWRESRIDYKINELIFIGLLKYFAWRVGAGLRFQLLLKAIRRGQASSFGIEPEFPLA